MATTVRFIGHVCRCFCRISSRENLLHRRIGVTEQLTQKHGWLTPSFLLFDSISSQIRLRTFNRKHIHTSITQSATKKAKSKKKGSTSNLKIDLSVADGVINIGDMQRKMEVQVQKCEEGMLKFSPKLNIGSIGDVFVKVNGEKTRLFEVASVTNSSRNDFIVTPMINDTKVFNDILTSLSQANLKLNPTVDGSSIRIPVPLASSERRNVLLKDAKSHSENIKVAIRKIRQQGLVDLRKVKNDISKDDLKKIENQIQLLTEKYAGEVDRIFSKKEAELKL